MGFFLNISLLSSNIVTFISAFYMYVTRNVSCSYFNVALHYTRKMVPIIGRASSFLVFFVCMLRGWEFSRKEEKETEKQQTYQFTQSYNILHRLQVHYLTLTSNINTTFIYI